MKISKTQLAGALIIEPNVFNDERGFFFESWNMKVWKEATGVDAQFVQDNQSFSQRGAVRGLHYQLLQPQGKLVRVTKGRVLDVAVDLRLKSKTFGQHITIELSGKNQKQFWIPPGFAHGYVVLSETANFLYKTTDYYAPDDEHCIIWNDLELNINWQLGNIEPLISKKDRNGQSFRAAPKYS